VLLALDVEATHFTIVGQMSPHDALANPRDAEQLGDGTRSFHMPDQVTHLTRRLCSGGGDAPSDVNAFDFGTASGRIVLLNGRNTCGKTCFLCLALFGQLTPALGSTSRVVRVCTPDCWVRLWLRCPALSSAAARCDDGRYPASDDDDDFEGRRMRKREFAELVALGVVAPLHSPTSKLRVTDAC